MKGDFKKWMETEYMSPTSYHPSSDIVTKAKLHKVLADRSALRQKGKDDYKYDYSSDPEHVLSDQPPMPDDSVIGNNSSSGWGGKTNLTSPEVQAMRNKQAAGPGKFVMAMGKFDKKGK